jgi:hypothetical protein
VRVLRGNEADELPDCATPRRRGAVRACEDQGEGRVDDSAGSLLPELACSELGYRWFDQHLEVGIADAHGVGMGARPEYYRFIFR